MKLESLVIADQHASFAAISEWLLRIRKSKEPVLLRPLLPTIIQELEGLLIACESEALDHTNSLWTTSPTRRDILEAKKAVKTLLRLKSQFRKADRLIGLTRGLNRSAIVTALPAQVIIPSPGSLPTSQLLFYSGMRKEEGDVRISSNWRNWNWKKLPLALLPLMLKSLPVLIVQSSKLKRPAVVAVVKKTFEEGRIPDNMNNILITLIPKQEKPATLAQCRPIPLCNVIYKVIAKVACSSGACFSNKWVSPLMSCVTASSLSVLWNGERTAAFTLGRGLSKAGVSAGFTYLFVLCMEKLAQNISSVVDTKVWKRLKPARWGPPILFRVQRLKVENRSSNLSGLTLRKAWTKKFHLLIAKKVMIDLDSRPIVG
ncbi:hypothetical protein Sango_2965600 [Sesamum angolense]|uniref:Uncharacterized protein n=1 Tax=Sesamum angolense TaxID=2727404 RepID=A0AAE1VUM8_9LAMI|nr:hypothetical protein Sango_2965600 [Sesamum angolense]